MAHFVAGAAIGFGDFRAGAGLSLAMTGTALALTTIVIGGGAMALRWSGPRGAPDPLPRTGPHGRAPCVNELEPTPNSKSRSSATSD